MSFKVVLLARARQDVQQIYEWLAEQSPDGAARWFNAFTSALESLEQDPASCSLAPEDEFVDRTIRERNLQDAARPAVPGALHDR